MDLGRARTLLKDFDLRRLFTEELGWDAHRATLTVEIDEKVLSLEGVAQKRGMAVFVCTAGARDGIPDYPTRRRIERQVAKSAHEHVTVFADADGTTQVWQWVKREIGKPTACREHAYHRTQPGDALLQKLQAIAVSLDEEEGLTLVDVTSRIRAAFDVERVTKRFYDHFKTEHAKFLKFLKGIPDEGMARWYVCVMLNRLMFIYFVQKKGFLDDDPDYLRHRLAESRDRGKDLYYTDFLCPLFFEGFAKRPDERSAAVNRLLGQVPYLNGGLFMRHQIEELHGKKIKISDKAFQRLFDFFDRYHWHLDERPLRQDNEINPDVLGYIFEKYINQKQMGAYYTKEDITGYIARNTVIPCLFDAARAKWKVAFEGEQSVWQHLASDPDRYIYEAVRRGVVDEEGNVIPESALPDFVQKGMHDPKARMFDKRYNLGEAVVPDPNGENLALPTEAWREYVERRKRCLALRQKLAGGEVREINDLITLNLDVCQFAQDVIENCEGPDLLRAIWRAIAGRVPRKSNERMIPGISILDPACGSGAFLFAALNILEPLYEACLGRMQAFLDELERSGKKHRPEKYSDFREILKDVEDHPSRPYFVYKSIVINNLYGVDIMDEAVEICKLRLFLKLVAQIEEPEDIEPLPDIDFNICAGNTLVGFVTREAVGEAISREQAGRLKQARLVYGEESEALTRIEEKAEDVDRLFTEFRRQQTRLGGTVTAEDKEELRSRLGDLEDELNRYLAAEYGIDPNTKTAYEDWLKSHQPFHWFIEFHEIMKRGGFDVAIGNPPYVRYRSVQDQYTVRDFATDGCGDLYALMMEQSLEVLGKDGRLGMIVPVSILSTDGFDQLRTLLKGSGRALWSASFAERPSKLFVGVEKRLTIALMSSVEAGHWAHLSRYHRWFAEERPFLFAQVMFTQNCDGQGLVGSSLPKVATPTEVGILSTIDGQDRLAEVFQGESKHVLYYTRKLRYFVQFLDFIPKITDGSGRAQEPSELKTICAASQEDRDVLIAVLNSSLFFWFLNAYSDVRNVNRREVNDFPCSVDGMQGKIVRKMCRLTESLMRDLDDNSREITGDYGKHGLLTIQSFQPRLSKPIIDQIDMVLAEHYGFSEGQMDFIINYDIKYRMGGTDSGSDE